MNMKERAEVIATCCFCGKEIESSLTITETGETAHADCLAWHEAEQSDLYKSFDNIFQSIPKRP